MFRLPEPLNFIINVHKIFLGIAILVLSLAGSRAAELVDWVDPMLGVVKGRGACVPGPCLPHSSIYPSPDTTAGGPGGYLPDQQVVGFSQLHAQGTGGVPSYGNFLVSPQIGLEIDEQKHSSDIAEEVGKPHAYRCRLTKYDILAEIAPSRHSALYRFTFPEAKDASILIDVARKIGQAVALDEGTVTVDKETGMISGGGTFSGNWNPAPYQLYFCAQFSRAPDAVGTWQDKLIQPGGASATSQKKSLGAFTCFETRSNEVIYLKIAVSFKSSEQAKVWLEQEIPGWDFDGLTRSARQIWNQSLASIQLAGTSPDEARKFYSHLYHSLTQPRDRTGDNPEWESSAPFYDDHYTLWDTWKTLFPLLAIIQPETVRGNVSSLIDRWKHHGYAATAFIQGKEFKVGQGGDEVDNIIADAYAKKIPGIDWDEAYQVLQSNAETARTENYRAHGYVSVEDKYADRRRMKSGSGTIAFAYNDYCVAQVAKGLGKTNDYLRYLGRAGNWTNVWDASLEDGGFKGFVRSRHQDGSFSATPARDGYNQDFYEGTCWIYSYGIPQDVPGMIAAMGGRKRFIERLTFALENNLIDFSNEPSFMTLWWFDAVGRPDLASRWADRLRMLYDERGCPGDDDSGAMASLYVFLDAGIFPVAGQDIYYLHGPRVGRVGFQMPNGKTFTIVGKNVSDKNIYIQSVMLNGQPLNKTCIHHADIVGGGTLEFVMGPNPSAWGQTEDTVAQIRN